MRRAALSAAGLGIVSVLAFGCANMTAPAAQPPTFVPPGGQSKCSIAASTMRPLIVEWSAADRAALEVLAQRGTVVVRYEGCEMEILPRCRAPGAYRYSATTRKTETVIIQDEDELYGNLPTGAVKLEGKLRRSGQLNVAMTVVGQFDAEQTNVGKADLEGDCRRATHVVTGLTVGAFEFSAGAAAETGGGVSVGGAGVGAGASSRRELLSSDGEVGACESVSRGDEEPPPGCGALLRVALAPLAAAVAAEECPPGAKRVGGACVADVVPPAESGQMLIRVTCGVLGDLVGEAEGLEVWVDGVRAATVEETRAVNAMSPGAPGFLQFVSIDVPPGEHVVRIGADGCEPMERVIRVQPGVPREVSGRLRPTSWHRLPPAGSMGFGIGPTYGVYSFDHVASENEDYEEIELPAESTKGFGGELQFSIQHFWMTMGAAYLKGDCRSRRRHASRARIACPRARRWMVPCP